MINEVNIGIFNTDWISPSENWRMKFSRGTSAWSAILRTSDWNWDIIIFFFYLDMHSNLYDFDLIVLAKICDNFSLFTIFSVHLVILFFYDDSCFDGTDGNFSVQCSGFDFNL